MIKNIDGRNFMYNDSTAGSLKYSCKHSDDIFTLFNNQSPMFNPIILWPNRESKVNQDKMNPCHS